MSNQQETFTNEEVTEAIKGWLDYGETSFVVDKPLGAPGHAGYFSGSGWAARCLRYHLTQHEALIAACQSLISDYNDGKEFTETTIRQHVKAIQKAMNGGKQ